MAFSKTAIVLLTFFVIFCLTVLTNRSKRTKGVVTYSIGDDSFDDDVYDKHHKMSGLLHVEQVIKKAQPDKNLTVVHVDFPHNDLGYTIMQVKILNYNSKITEKELVEEDKEDDNFWVLVSDGEIESDSITIEINSVIDIDVDVEFYGYLD